MKKTDYNTFKINLNLNIEIDNSLRRITEKIKIAVQHRDYETLKYIVDFLRDTDEDIDKLINEQICKDE